jgi:hypothetical protein
MWEEKRKEAEFRAVEAARRVDVAKEETRQLEIKSQEAIAMATRDSDARQLAILELSKAQVCCLVTVYRIPLKCAAAGTLSWQYSSTFATQSDLLTETERTSQLQAAIEAERVKVLFDGPSGLCWDASSCTPVPTCIE